MKDNRRFLINIGANLLFLGVNVALMVFYVPFLLRHIGPAAYGMIALMNSLAMMATIFTQGVETSTARFMSIGLNRDDRDGALDIYAAALTRSFEAGALVLLLASGVAWALPHLCSVPADLLPQTRALVMAGALTVCCALAGATFGAPALIMQRFELRNLARAIASLSRVAIVVACFSIISPSLWQVAFAFAASAMLGLLAEIMICVRLTPWLKFTRCRGRDKARRDVIWQLTGMSNWASLNQAGVLLMMQLDLLVVNALFGATATGQYGALIVLASLVYMLTDALAVVLTPMFLSLYSEGDRPGLRRLASRSMRLLGLTLALPAGLIAGMSGALLGTWLGSDYEPFAPVLAVLVIHLPVSLGARPVSYILMAYNRLRMQALVTIVAGSVALVLAVVMGKAWGLLGVACAMATSWTLRNVLFICVYGARTLGMSPAALIAPLWKPACAVFVVATIAHFASAGAHDLPWLVLIGALISTTYAMGFWIFGLELQERSLVTSTVIDSWRTLKLGVATRGGAVTTKPAED